MRKIPWVKGTVNLDYGGGKYSTATAYLQRQGVTNLVYDPFNRDYDHNREVVNSIVFGQVVLNTVTLFNVLNVIKEPTSRYCVLMNIRSVMRLNPAETTLYISCYRGKTAPSGPTCNGWQENRALHTYLDEVRKVFPRVEISGQMLVAKY
jgi:hypothetical protein